MPDSSRRRVLRLIEINLLRTVSEEERAAAIALAGDLLADHDAVDGADAVLEADRAALAVELVISGGERPLFDWEPFSDPARLRTRQDRRTGRGRDQ